MGQDGTLKLSFSDGNRWDFTGLEVVATRSDGRGSAQHVQLNKPILKIGSSPDCDVVLDDPSIGPSQASLHCREKSIFFTNNNTKVPSTVNGQKMSLGEVTENATIVIGPFQLRLVSTAGFWGYLEAYSSPNRGRRWVLREELVTIGRAGTRKNTVEIEDPTVSRAHATIKRLPDKAQLLVESSSGETYVNGQRVNGQIDLKDGDLIQTGQQLLRYTWTKG